ncbi:MAG: hypothetical protein NHB36_03965 [Nitrospira sp.]|nr:hypothetical protein [Nitrospira sp.]
MNLVQCLSTITRGCLYLAVATLLSCETPSHLREDFGVSYREAIRVQTDRDHVHRSVAGSTLDGRAAASLYEEYVKHYASPGERSPSPDPATPSSAMELFSGGGSSQTNAMPTGELSGEPKR